MTLSLIILSGLFTGMALGFCFCEFLSPENDE